LEVGTDAGIRVVEIERLLTDQATGGAASCLYDQTKTDAPGVLVHRNGTGIDRMTQRAICPSGTDERDDRTGRQRGGSLAGKEGDHSGEIGGCDQGVSVGIDARATREHAAIGIGEQRSIAIVEFPLQGVEIGFTDDSVAVGVTGERIDRSGRHPRGRKYGKCNHPPCGGMCQPPSHVSF
jgi:hypothetical protein